jgi:transcriptional regulator with XRE-family HTH domain
MITQPALGKKIAEIRKAKGMTQEELVERCQLNVRTLQRIESGEVTPRGYTLKIIFSELEYPFEEHLDSDTTTQTKPTVKRSFREHLNKGIFYIKDLFNFKTHAMRKITILTLSFSVLILTLVVLPSMAQTKTQKQLVGLWRQTGVMTVDGTIVSVVTGRYRITNPDNTFLMFTENSSTAPNAAFWQSGTIQFLSDSSSVEHILMHREGIDGRFIEVHFRFLDDNTLLSKWRNGSQWITECWERIYSPSSGKIDAKVFEGLNLKPIDTIAGKVN